VSRRVVSRFASVSTVCSLSVHIHTRARKHTHTHTLSLSVSLSLSLATREAYSLADITGSDEEADGTSMATTFEPDMAINAYSVPSLEVRVFLLSLVHSFALVRGTPTLSVSGLLVGFVLRRRLLRLLPFLIVAIVTMVLMVSEMAILLMMMMAVMMCESLTRDWVHSSCATCCSCCVLLWWCGTLSRVYVGESQGESEDQSEENQEEEEDLAVGPFEQGRRPCSLAVLPGGSS
jgi:hypothetical protein